MELKKCPEGHYYDASVHSECPKCRELDPLDSHTIPLDTGSRDNGQPMYDTQGDTSYQEWRNPARPTEPVSGYPKPGETMGMDETDTPIRNPIGGNGRKIRDDNRTIAVVNYDLDIDPVVGWLVSVNGKEKGRDYRIHTDNNYIGRSENMDICIRGDNTISRENQAIISYDSREKIFYFAPNGGRSIVRLNGKAVLGMQEMHAYDEIEIGRTRLVFIPLCGERFEWTNDE